MSHDRFHAELSAVDADELFDRLRTVAGLLDPVPSEVVAAAKASYTWRTVDAELAVLSYDSFLDAEILAGVRGSRGARQLTFSSPALTIEVEVEPGTTPALSGQIVSPEPAVMEVRTEQGTRMVEVDELGRFEVTELPAGLVSFRCSPRRVGLPAVATDWVRF